MRARLFCKYGIMKGKGFEFEREATIGRGERSDIALNTKEISKEHARIFLDLDKGCYFLEDSSTNGTQLDGMKVSGRERLGHLHVITFANLFDFIFLDTELCKKRYSQEQHGNQPSVDKTSPGPKPEQPSKVTEDETLMEQMPFVLPKVLGQAVQGGLDLSKGVEETLIDKGAEPEDKTMMEERPFILPGKWGQRKKEKDGTK